MPWLSRKSAHIAQSEIRVMSVECERVGGINLAQGICDTEVPAPVRRAAQAAIADGRNQYVRLDGIRELRHAIARKLRLQNALDVDPERELVVTSGSTGAFFSACMALLDPGDEVILFEPFYGYHVHTVAALGAVPVMVELTPPAWDFSPDALRRAVTSNTRAIVVNTPANPSGKVFRRQELECIAALAAEHDLFVLTDEIYEHFLYDGAQHISPATLSGMFERTITIGGFSKSYSITGWRIGFAACSAPWAAAIGYFSDLAYICAPSPLQHGVLAGLNALDESFYRNLNAEYAAKRRLLCAALQDAGLEPFMPQGSYYVLADATRIPGQTGKDKAMYLLEKTRVAAVPGEAFYRHGGQHLLRFCFAKTTPDLREAAARLQQLALPVEQ